MISCDVIIVGGGPAGSSCAWKLQQAGCDVIVADGARFPRNKPCAGWITPPVLDALQLNVEDYRRGRVFQPIRSFAVGLIDGGATVPAMYDEAVSFAIRRCEFDDYLLQRCGARLRLGQPVSSIARAGGGWMIDDAVRAPVLVGAGGHFCPVARLLNARGSPAPLVVAQEAEWPVSGEPCEPGGPELYFCPDLKGYGWVVPKQGHLNVGIGRLDRRSLPQALAGFLVFLRDRRQLWPPAGVRWAGHAYLLRDARHRRVIDDGVLLAGDAAGLADARSGEGIRQAIESGLAAADTIVDAGGSYSRERLEPYAAWMFRDVTSGAPGRLRARAGASGAGRGIGRWLLRRPAFVRHVVLDRWFLHRAS
jgi:geranylgeranyl reductase family protein